MLVLSRKCGEAVIVGSGDNRCEVSVVEMRGDSVRLGFTAAHDVPIDREEIRAAKNGKLKTAVGDQQIETP